MGLEPTPSCEDRILSPARLPFRHFGVHAASFFITANAHAFCGLERAETKPPNTLHWNGHCLIFSVRWQAAGADRDVGSVTRTPLTEHDRGHAAPRSFSRTTSHRLLPQICANFLGAGQNPGYKGIFPHGLAFRQGAQDLTEHGSNNTDSRRLEVQPEMTVQPRQPTQ